MRNQDNQRASVREALRRRRARNLLAGICVDCAKRPARPTPKGSYRKATLCAECASKHVLRSTERRDRLKAEGKCTQCGKRPPRPDCYECIECSPTKKVVREKVMRPTERLDRMMELLEKVANRRAA